MTYDATRLVDHEEIPFFVVEYNLDWSGCYRRFVPMNDVPGRINTINTNQYFAFSAGNTDSMRSPFLTTVQGFATSPLIVVTPESRAYLCSGR